MHKCDITEALVAYLIICQHRDLGTEIGYNERFVQWLPSVQMGDIS